ncbi:uncharacterized protein MELLADRAFT_62263 [Melampsora larici-populina 98AG31]|uniref:Uncharacterized protein n=1 Tax=Melampsora larici-populina (strain 98AG31 / pathotype 3-4-7) TaxID=747676 RepID=F4RI70_MELLP|nr:uncharacterized protein MELLADRAFT_62263 [Melampsora larici-populina 98AG31]EGG08014.1 hypothetical protein MELLADRAFT_62263 [Melampsora larici-populina 98AG31]
MAKEFTQNWFCDPRQSNLPTHWPYALNENNLQLIFETLEEDSNLMLDEISNILEDLTDKKPCISTLQSTITKQLNYSLKKGQTVDPWQSKEQQAEYARRVANLPSQVFLDKVGMNERDVVHTHLRAPMTSLIQGGGYQPAYSICSSFLFYFCVFGFIAIDDHKRLQSQKKFKFIF